MLKALGVVALVAALVVGLLWAFQRSLIYVPDDAPRTPPAAVGAEVVTLRTSDGLDLTAWFFPTTAGAARGTVLVAPGNAGSRAARVPLATELAAEGLDVLVLEYRGFGGNPGSPDEEGLAADARAAYDHLVRDRGVDPRRLVLFGESLGGAVTIRLATEVPVGAMVLRSPFTSLADVGARVYPVLPVRWLLADRFDSLARAPALEVPTTVVVGTQDEVVPAEQSRELAAALDAAAVELPGARHNDAALVSGPRVVAATVAAAERAGR